MFVKLLPQATRKNHFGRAAEDEINMSGKKTTCGDGTAIWSVVANYKQHAIYIIIVCRSIVSNYEINQVSLDVFPN